MTVKSKVARCHKAARFALAFVSMVLFEFSGYFEKAKREGLRVRCRFVRQRQLSCEPIRFRKPTRLSVFFRVEAAAPAEWRETRGERKTVWSRPGAAFPCPPPLL